MSRHSVDNVIFYQVLGRRKLKTPFQNVKGYFTIFHLIQKASTSLKRLYDKSRAKTPVWTQITTDTYFFILKAIVFWIKIL